MMMKTWFENFTRFFLRRAERLLFVGLWAAILALVLFNGNLFHFSDALQNFENLLLDIRLQLQAEDSPPASDIAIVAMDQFTADYGRNHPQSGLDGRILPRDRLAELIRYLHHEGAKAIVLDVEMRAPQDPAKDKALAQAIREAGNVYLTASVDLPFEDFMASKASEPPVLQSEERGVFIFNQWFLPRLKQWLQFEKLCLPHPLPSAALHGFTPFFHPFQTLNISSDVLSALLRLQWNKLDPIGPAFFASSLPDSSDADVRETRASFAQMVEMGYEQQCTDELYKSAFQNNPDYLRLLNKQRMPFFFTSETLLNPFKQKATYCQISPIQESFIAVAKGLGVSTVDYEQDAYIRTIPSFYRTYQGAFLPYLGLRPALDLLNVRSVSYQPDAFILRSVSGSKTIPLIDGRSFLIQWHHPKEYIADLYHRYGLPLTHADEIRTDKANRDLGYGHLYRLISVSDLLRWIDFQKKESPGTRNAKTEKKDTLPELPSLYNLFDQPQTGAFSFKDKIVIYGDTVKDLHRTPIGRTIYGPEIVATVLDNVLHERKFVRKTSVWLDFLIGFVLCALVGFSILCFKRLSTGFTVGILMLLGYWFYDFFLFIKLYFWMPVVFPSLCLILTIIFALLYRYYVHDREKRELAQVFSNYVSPQVMKQILENPGQAMGNLQGCKKELTVLFCDIQGFTQKFENQEPESMVLQLNEFFDVMVQILLQHGGTYDKYMGDAIMAFFGAPAEIPQHAQVACQAALKMQEAMSELNKRWETENKPLFHCGIGLSTGTMFVGNFGSRQIKNFTVMGSAVNLGSRLESYTRECGASIIISEKTYETVQHEAVVSSLGQIKIKGFSMPVQAYSLEGWK